MTAVVEFLFILIVPLVIVGGALVTLFAVGALFEILENPAGLSGQIDALFRRPPKEPKPLDPGHYYQRYWPSEKTP
jgi:hypothetical protein